MAYSTALSAERRIFSKNYLLKFFLIVFFVCWAVTYFNTTNRTNWVTENVLTIIFICLLVFTYKKFKFSDLSYTLFFVYILLHIYGSEYTYAENPFGYWLKDTFSLNRNYYDRIVHFSFGFMLAYPMMDYFKNYMQWPDWVCWVLPIEITMSFSAVYELIEWLVADVFYPEEGAAYLGSQGDIWDAQKDMALACSGALISMLIFRIIKGIKKPAMNI